MHTTLKRVKKRLTFKKKKPTRFSIPTISFLECLIAIVAGIAITGGVLHVVQKKTAMCANSISCVKNLTATVENNVPGYFEGQEVTPPVIDLAEKPNPSKVLGAETSAGEKHIYVDLSTQTLFAYQGNTLIMSTLVSTGKWNPTPTGDYKIWVKLRSTRMSGGEGADAYDLPNVPFVMFFYNDKVSKAQGYSLHGAYWHNNFGHMMSHGCVNMRAIDAEAIYNWADPPTVKPTTYADAQNPGTIVSICTSLKSQPGAAPSCVE